MYVCMYAYFCIIPNLLYRLILQSITKDISIMFYCASLDYKLIITSLISPNTECCTIEKHEVVVTPVHRT